MGGLTGVMLGYALIALDQLHVLGIISGQHVEMHGSLRDVHQLAGHRSIEQTQAYIDGSARAKRRLIELL